MIRCLTNQMFTSINRIFECTVLCLSSLFRPALVRASFRFCHRRGKNSQVVSVSFDSNQFKIGCCQLQRSDDGRPVVHIESEVGCPTHIYTVCFLLGAKEALSLVSVLFRKHCLSAAWRVKMSPHKAGTWAASMFLTFLLPGKALAHFFLFECSMEEIP